MYFQESTQFWNKKSFTTMTRSRTFFNSSNSELQKVLTLDTEAIYIYIYIQCSRGVRH